MITQLKASTPALVESLTEMVSEEHWTSSMVANVLGDSQHEVWSWSESGDTSSDTKPDGLCIVGVGPYELEIEMIVVVKSQRRKGIAKTLLNHVQNRVLQLQKEQLFLEVRESNIPAQQLYISQHMKQVGVRKGYYPTSNGERENALLFAWEPSEERVGEE